jgi:hypothetical protein
MTSHPGNPAVMASEPKTGGFASPPFDGFAFSPTAGSIVT